MIHQRITKASCALLRLAAVLALILTVSNVGAVTKGSVFDPADFATIGAIGSLDVCDFNTTDATAVISGTPVVGTFAQSSSGNATVAVFCFTSVNIGVTPTIAGQYPIAILSQGNIVVGADINLDGSAAPNLPMTTDTAHLWTNDFNTYPPAAPGAGGFRGGMARIQSTDAENGPGRARVAGQWGSGGGASYGGLGGQGARHPENGGVPGPTYGNDSLTDLLGGSGGSGSSDLATNYTALYTCKNGGGGGGAIELSAATNLTVNLGATISAKGAKGGSTLVATHPDYAVDTYRYAGGGGSGGAILLAGTNVTVLGLLDVSGGAGGDSEGTQNACHSGGGGGGGRVALYYPAGGTVSAAADRFVLTGALGGVSNSADTGDPVSRQGLPGADGTQATQQLLPDGDTLNVAQSDASAATVPFNFPGQESLLSLAITPPVANEVWTEGCTVSLTGTGVPAMVGQLTLRTDPNANGLADDGEIIATANLDTETGEAYFTSGTTVQWTPGAVQNWLVTAEFNLSAVDTGLDFGLNLDGFVVNNIGGDDAVVISGSSSTPQQVVSAVGAVVYVDASAAPAGDGTSWATAYQTISDGVANAYYPANVWVAQGTYAELVTGRQYVSMYGGFAGTETTVAGRSGTTTTITGSDTTQCMVFNNVRDLTIDGFDMTNGKASDGPDDPYSFGGAMSLFNSRNINVTDCTFRDSLAYDKGGGMFANNVSNLNIADCAFIHNDTEIDDGGGLGLQTVEGGTIDNCLFAGNTCDIGGADDGGGLFVNNSSLAVTDSTFTRNISGDHGGGVWITSNQSRTLTFDNCTITHNEAQDSGGGASSNDSDAVFTNCLIRYNVCGTVNAGGDGGGVRTNNGTSRWIDCDISYNYAQDRGGGVYNNGSKNPLNYSIFERCDITNNEANDDGAGIGCNQANPIFIDCLIENNVLTNSANGSLGGGLFADNDNSFPILYGCTIRGNSTAGDGRGAAVAVNGGGGDAGNPQQLRAQCALVSCVITDNTCKDEGPITIRSGLDAASNSANVLYMINCVVDNNITTDGNDEDSAIHVESDGSTLYAYNNIIANNPDGGITLDNDPSVAYLYNNWFFNNGDGTEAQENGDVIRRRQGDTWVGAAEVNTIVDPNGDPAAWNNIDGDPLLDANYKPAATDGIDAGTADITADARVDLAGTLDIAGAPRIQGAAVDIGAYEAAGATSLVFVDADAAGGGDGASWATAYNDLQTGINAGPGEVFVKAGTLNPYIGPVFLASGVAVYGGFLGTEASLGERDLDANPKTTITDGNTVVLADSDYMRGARLDGFEIINGLAAGAGNDGSGGGIRIAGLDNDTVIANCDITGNECAVRGGGIFIQEDANATISNCTISGNTNTAVDSNDDCGGGIAVRNATALIEDCTISGNTAFMGGGLHVKEGNAFVTVQRCVISDNTSLATADWGNAGGSGVWQGSGGNVTLINCEVVGNTAASGGAIRYYAYDRAEVNLDIINCTVADNTNLAADGVAGYQAITEDTPLLINNIFANHVGGYAVAEMTTRSDLSMVNNLFYNNADGDYYDSDTATDVTGAGVNALAPAGITAGNAGNINGDPIFNDPSSGDYGLGLYSTAVDVGTATGAPADDINGVSRPQDIPLIAGSGYDIGAHEQLAPSNNDTLNVARQNPLAPNTPTVPGRSEEMMDLAMTIASGEVDVASVTVGLSGGDPAGISKVSIEQGGSEIGSGTFAGATAVITFAPYPRRVSAATTWTVVFEFNATAAGNTYIANVSNTAYTVSPSGGAGDLVAYSGSGDSAPVDVVAMPDLVVAAVTSHSNVLDNDRLSLVEFIEIANVSTVDTYDLGGMQIRTSDQNHDPIRIAKTFASGTMIAPGEHIVLGRRRCIGRFRAGIAFDDVPGALDDNNAIVPARGGVAIFLDTDERIKVDGFAYGNILNSWSPHPYGEGVEAFPGDNNAARDRIVYRKTNTPSATNPLVMERYTDTGDNSVDLDRTEIQSNEPSRFAMLGTYGASGFVRFMDQARTAGGSFKTVGADTLTVAGVDLTGCADLAMIAGAHIPLLEVALSAGTGEVDVTDLNVTLSGGAAGDVAEIGVWELDAGGVIGRNTANRWAVEAPAGASTNLTLREPIRVTAGTEVKVVITVALNDTATGAIGAELTAAGDVTVDTITGGADTVAGTFPVASGTLAVGTFDGGVVISEVLPFPGAAQFLELYNSSGTDIDLSAYTIQWKGNVDNGREDTWFDMVLPADLAGKTIRSYGYFLIAGASWTGLAPDVTLAGEMPTWNNGSIRVLSGCNVETDMVGWRNSTSTGDTNWDAEGGHLLSVLTGTASLVNSFERKAEAASDGAAMRAGGINETDANAQDTNQNLDDFVVHDIPTGYSDPQNSQSLREKLGITDPQSGFSQLAFDFGLVGNGDSADIILTITNTTTGTNNLIINNIVFASGDPVFLAAPVAPATYPVSIAPGASDDFTLTYQPIATGQSNSAVLQVISNDPLLSPANLIMSGESYDDVLTVAALRALPDGSNARITNLVTVGSATDGLRQVSLNEFMAQDATGGLWIIDTDGRATAPYAIGQRLQNLGGTLEVDGDGNGNMVLHLGSDPTVGVPGAPPTPAVVDIATLTLPGDVDALHATVVRFDGLVGVLGADPFAVGFYSYDQAGQVLPVRIEAGSGLIGQPFYTTGENSLIGMLVWTNRALNLFEVQPRLAGDLLKPTIDAASPLVIADLVLSGAGVSSVTDLDVTNIGGIDLDLTAAAITGPSAAVLALNPAPAFTVTLGPTAIETFKVELTADDEADIGPVSATLTIDNTDPADPARAITITGNINAAVAHTTSSVTLAATRLEDGLTDANLPMIKDGETIDATFYITNTGNVTLNVAGMAIGGVDAVQFASDVTGAFTVAPGATQLVVVTYTANGTGTGLVTHNATLDFTSDDLFGAGATVSIPLVGKTTEDAGPAVRDFRAYGTE